MSEQSQNLEDMSTISLFQPGHTIAWNHLTDLDWPWEALTLINLVVLKLIEGLDAAEYETRPGNVWIHKTATIAPTAAFGSDIIIGAGTDIRHCAFIRGPAIVGEWCVVGNSTELKNVMLFDGVQVPHFNYIGDSILGYKSHFGAGAITSNVKSDSTPISVIIGSERIETGFKKFGAIIGDNVEIGCNAVLNPGTVIGSDSIVYPLSMVRGFLPACSIYKRQGEITKRV